jgi:hypothetical protein
MKKTGDAIKDFDERIRPVLNPSEMKLSSSFCSSGEIG